MIDGARLELRTVSNLQQLGSEWDPGFAAANHPQSTREWYAATIEAALPGDSTPYFACLFADGAPLLCVPMLHQPGRRCQSMSTPYTTLWQPLPAPHTPPPVFRKAAILFGRHSRRYASVRFEALDDTWPLLPELIGGLRRAGLRCRTFLHFGNWHTAAPNGWDSYLQSRPGALRETIKRKTKGAFRSTSITVELFQSEEQIQRGYEAYEAVYARSWKTPEPFPQFGRRLLLHLSARSIIRLFVLFDDGAAIAAQYWTVFGNKATVMKLAHVQGREKLSPGTVLTAAAIRHLLERDGVTELDFGRGDDPYKQAWAGDRRQRIGLLALHPYRPAGIAELVRHDVGRLIRSRREALPAD